MKVTFNINWYIPLEEWASQSIRPSYNNASYIQAHLIQLSGSPVFLEEYKILLKARNASQIKTLFVQTADILSDFVIVDANADGIELEIHIDMKTLQITSAEPYFPPLPSELPLPTSSASFVSVFSDREPASPEASITPDEPDIAYFSFDRDDPQKKT